MAALRLAMPPRCVCRFLQGVELFGSRQLSAFSRRLWVGVPVTDRDTYVTLHVAAPALGKRGSSWRQAFWSPAGVVSAGGWKLVP